jgi:PIN domain nuclease of toxin-antitoxin system
LSKRVAAELEDRLSELWLSPIVVWEVLMLAERGRVSLKPDAATWVRRVCQTVPFREAP